MHKYPNTIIASTKLQDFDVFVVYIDLGAAISEGQICQHNKTEVVQQKRDTHTSIIATATIELCV